VRHFLLDAGTMPYLDTTGAASLDQLHGDLKDAGIVLAVAAAVAPVRIMLGRTGVAERLGPERMFPSVALAVATLSNREAPPELVADRAEPRDDAGKR